jgi:hypothetical protein
MCVNKGTDLVLANTHTTDVTGAFGDGQMEHEDDVYWDSIIITALEILRFVFCTILWSVAPVTTMFCYSQC